MTKLNEASVTCSVHTGNRQTCERMCKNTNTRSFPVLLKYKSKLSGNCNFSDNINNIIDKHLLSLETANIEIMRDYHVIQKC